jgi:hypothetical protein
MVIRPSPFISGTQQCTSGCIKDTPRWWVLLRDKTSGARFILAVIFAVFMIVTYETKVNKIVIIYMCFGWFNIF